MRPTVQRLSTPYPLAESLKMVSHSGDGGGQNLHAQKTDGGEGKPLTALVQLAGQSEVTSSP